MMTQLEPCKPPPNRAYGRSGINDLCCLSGTDPGHRFSGYDGHIAVGANSLIMSALNDFKTHNAQVAFYRMQREVILMTATRIQDELYVVAWRPGRPQDIFFCEEQIAT